jgi:hypothetical protein
MSTTAFPINPTLTAIALAYINPAYTLIADEVLPRIGTGKKFTYTVYDPAQGYTVPQTLVGRKSEPTVVDFTGTPVADEVKDYGLDDIVTNDDQKAFDDMPKPATGGPLSPMNASTMFLTGLVQLDREIRVANTVFNAATYAAGNQVTLAGTSQWSDFANSNPVDAIMSALDVPLFRPNLLTFGQATWTKLRQHPKMVQAILGTAQGSGAVTRQQVADFFEVKKVVVGAGFVNNARKGQAPVNSRVWGKHAAALYIDPVAAQVGQPTFGWTAMWGSKVAGDIPAPLVGLRGGVRVRSGESVKEVITANILGYFFQNAVA